MMQRVVISVDREAYDLLRKRAIWPLSLAGAVRELLGLKPLKRGPKGPHKRKRGQKRG